MLRGFWVKLPSWLCLSINFSCGKCELNSFSCYQDWDVEYLHQTLLCSHWIINHFTKVIRMFRKRLQIWQISLIYCCLASDKNQWKPLFFSAVTDGKKGRLKKKYPSCESKICRSEYLHESLLATGLKSHYLLDNW